MSKDLVLTKCILHSKVLWCRQRENYGRIPEILVSDRLVHLTGLLLVWLLLTLRTLSSGIRSCVHILYTVKPHFEIFFPFLLPPSSICCLAFFLSTYLSVSPSVISPELHWFRTMQKILIFIWLLQFTRYKCFGCWLGIQYYWIKSDFLWVT